MDLLKVAVRAPVVVSHQTVRVVCQADVSRRQTIVSQQMSVAIFLGKTKGILGTVLTFSYFRREKIAYRLRNCY